MPKAAQILKLVIEVLELLESKRDEGIGKYPNYSEALSDIESTSITEPLLVLYKAIDYGMFRMDILCIMYQNKTAKDAMWTYEGPDGRCAMSIERKRVCSSLP